MQQSLAVKAGQTLLVGFPTEICCLISRAIHKHTHMSFPFFFFFFIHSEFSAKEEGGWLVGYPLAESAQFSELPLARRASSFRVDSDK